MKHRLALWLRRTADHMDPPRKGSASRTLTFDFTRGEVRDDRCTCPKAIAPVDYGTLSFAASIGGPCPHHGPMHTRNEATG